MAALAIDAPVAAFVPAEGRRGGAQRLGELKKREALGGGFHGAALACLAAIASSEGAGVSAARRPSSLIINLNEFERPP